MQATLQQFEPGGDIAQWRQGKAGDWDVLGNGFPSPTGLALTIMQGMYAGTAEKEATRDTYHGYVFPEITAVITQASEEADPARRDALLADAQRRIWETCPMTVVVRAEGGPGPAHPHRRNRRCARPTPTISPPCP